MSNTLRAIHRAQISSWQDVVKYDAAGKPKAIGRMKVGTGGQWWRARFADLVEKRRVAARKAVLAAERAARSAS